MNLTPELEAAIETAMTALRDARRHMESLAARLESAADRNALLLRADEANRAISGLEAELMDDLSVFDPIPETREPLGECRRCGASLYSLPKPEDYDPYALMGPLCFQCWVRVDAAEAEYIAAFTHGGTR